MKATKNRSLAAGVGLALAVVGLGWARGARADVTWDASGANAGTPADGGGTWNLTGINWSDGTTDAAWPNDGTVADFGSGNGAAGTVTLGAAINAGGLTFLPAGSGNYTLTGGTLTLIGATPTITVTGAIAPTITATLAGTNGLIYGGTGTLALGGANTYSGATLIQSGLVEMTNAAAFGTSTVTVDSGGEVEAGTSAALTVANNFSIAGTGTGTGGALVVRGTMSGAITLTGNARIGDGGFTDTFSGAIGGTGALEFYSAATGTSTFKLTNAGNNWTGPTTVTNASAAMTVLQMGGSNFLPAGNSMTLNAAGSGVAELDMAGRSETVAGLASAGTAANDKIINSSTGSSTLTISSSDNYVFGGTILAGTGTGITSVAKAGAGMETLAGANTYAGNTTVNDGTLSVTGSLLSTGNVTVNAATLAGTGSMGNVLMNNAAATVNPGATGAGSVGTLTMNNLTVAGGVLQFDLANAAAAGANDALAVSGTTTFTGTSAIAPSAGAAPGTYTLLTDAGGIAYGDFTPTLTAPNTPAGYRPGATYALATNATSIQLTIAGGAANLTWSGRAPGDGTTWDVATNQNWNNAGSADVFYNGDAVAFDDSSAGGNITLSTPVLPGAMTFNNNLLNYTIAGAGSIGGVASLTMNGAATLTLATTNTYSGGTTINNGTLNAGAPSALGAGPIVLNAPAQLNVNDPAFGSGPLAINGGTLDNTSGADIAVTTNNAQTWGGSFTFAGTNSLNLGTGAVALNADVTVTVNANTLTIAGSIADGTAGSNLTKAGPGTLALMGANSYAGATTLAAGAVLVNNSASLGAVTGGAVTINGGTLDLGGDLVANTIAFGAKPFFIAGTGGAGGGAGAITNSGISQYNAFDFLTLTADATISGDRIDIGRSGTGDVLDLANHTLTLNMSGAAPLFGIEKNASVTSGTIVVAGGTLDIEQTAVVQADGTGSSIIFNPGTNVQFYQAAAGYVTRPMVFNGGNVIGSSNGASATVNSPMTLQGNVTLEAIATGVPSATADYPLTLAGNIEENGGSYAVTMAGASTITLSGANTYSGGTTVNAGTLLVGNASGSALGTGNVTLNGGTLGGTGSIAGSILAGTGPHTIHPGPGGGVAGTLAVGGDLVTNANTTLAFDLTAPGGANGMIAVVGNVTLGGGTLAIASQGATGAAALGYYSVLAYAGSLTGSTGGIVLPAVVNNLSYTLDTAQTPGFVDVHLGYIGDANDDGTVDLNDLNIVLNNLGTANSSWGKGNFDGAATIDLNDLNDVLNHLGTSIASSDGTQQSVGAIVTATPEPATLGLAACGAAALLLRRKRPHLNV